MQSSCGLAPKSASGIFVTSKKSGSSFQNCSLAGANRLYFAKRIVLAAVETAWMHSSKGCIASGTYTYKYIAATSTHYSSTHDMHLLGTVTHETKL